MNYLLGRITTTREPASHFKVNLPDSASARAALDSLFSRDTGNTGAYSVVIILADRAIARVNYSRLACARRRTRIAPIKFRVAETPDADGFRLRGCVSDKRLSERAGRERERRKRDDALKSPQRRALSKRSRAT